MEIVKKHLSKKSKNIINSYIIDLFHSGFYWLFDKNGIHKSEEYVKKWFVKRLNSNTKRFEKSIIKLSHHINIKEEKKYYILRIVIDGNVFQKKVQIKIY